MTESFKLSFYQLVSLFSVSELHWCAPTEGVFRLLQPGGGGGFVAKNKLGLMLNQLNVIHFLVLGRIAGVCSVLASGRGRSLGLGAIFSKHLDAARDDQYWLNHVAIADEQIERDPG